MKKTLLAGLLIFGGMNLMAQTSAGNPDNQIRIKTVKPPRPERPENGSPAPTKGSPTATGQTIKSATILAPTDKPATQSAPEPKDKDKRGSRKNINSGMLPLE